jgi:hypothetical protein
LGFVERREVGGSRFREIFWIVRGGGSEVWGLQKGERWVGVSFVRF